MLCPPSIAGKDCSKMAQILIIDDDEMFSELLAVKVRELGHKALMAATIAQGSQLTSQQLFDVVLLDVSLPDGNGLDLLPRLKQMPQAPEVLIITGAGNADGAELAIKSGAWDYVQKGSVSLQEMALTLNRALQYRREKTASKQPLALKREGIIGKGQRMQACYDLLAQAASSEANVLINGETGTGKELFARAVHRNSSRADDRFVVVDCAAIPDSLVESLLFGHKRGTFTGADRSRKGLIEQAHGGSLFLDEVGELPMGMQKAFLRVLQERRFRPLGASTEIESNFRLIAATNRDLDQMVQKGRFRQDLLYRLRSLNMELPPLRERLEDLRDLVLFHIDAICDRFGVSYKGFNSDFMDALKRYEWPGNVRELVNTLEQAITSAGDSPTLFPHYLPERMRISLARSSMAQDTESQAINGQDQTPQDTEAAATPQPPQSAQPQEAEPVPTGLGDHLPPWKEYLKNEAAEAERRYLDRLLDLAKGDINQACEMAGLSRSTLYHHLKKHGITARAS
jgi:two-component system NtrC family response regulator